MASPVIIVTNLRLRLCYYDYLIYKSIYLTYAGLRQFLAMYSCAGKRLQALQYLRCITTASVNHKYRGCGQEILTEVSQLVAMDFPVEVQVARLDYSRLFAKLQAKMTIRKVFTLITRDRKGSGNPPVGCPSVP